jgi:MFS transporter, FSR family, fosmidomycin resistance protein
MAVVTGTSTTATASNASTQAPERADWHLRGLLTIAFGHGVSDFFSGTVALTIFFVISTAHLAPWYQGLVGFLWYLMSSVVQPLFGAYTDRHGRWWFMPTAVLAVVAALSFATLSTSVWMLAGLILLGGIGSAVMHPEAGKYAALLSGSRRSQGISIFQMGGSIGFAFGPAAITALIAHYGRMGSLVLFVPGLLAVCVLFVVIKGADSLAKSVGLARTHRSGSATRVDRFGIALVVASTTMRFMTTISFVTYLPNLLTGRGDSLATAGSIVTGFLVLANVGMWLGGYFGDRFGPIPASVASLVLAVPCLMGFFFTPTPVAIGLLVLANMLLAVQNAPGVVLVQSMLPKNLGMALGLINGVAFGLGSLLVTAVGFLVARVGPETALEAVSFAPLIAASAYVVISRRLEPPTPRPVQVR